MPTAVQHHMGRIIVILASKWRDEGHLSRVAEGDPLKKGAKNVTCIRAPGRAVLHRAALIIKSGVNKVSIQCAVIVALTGRLDEQQRE